MNIKCNKWIGGLAIGVTMAMLSGALHAVDPGINQPGVRGGTAGVGAPGAGTWDPGINQPGALGNTAPARRSVRFSPARCTAATTFSDIQPSPQALQEL